MDAKITLSFDKNIIDKAKAYADKNNISLSRLTEYLLSRAIDKNFYSLEDLPISDWVSVVAEGNVAYETKARKKRNLKDEFFNSKK